MMEMEDKLRVLGDSSPQQTHLCESGDAIEFSNICLRSPTDAMSTDRINHRNELFRTHNRAMLPDIAEKASSQVSISFLSTHRGTLLRKPFLVRTLAFKGWRSVGRKHSFLILKITAKHPSCVNQTSAFVLLHCKGGHLQTITPSRNKL